MDAAILADFWGRNHSWIAALICIVVALALAGIADRFLMRRGLKLAQAVSKGGLTPEADTRLRFLRRLVVAVIILVGVAAAISQVDGLGQLAASLFASSAIAAAVVGFAARQTVANVIAGVMLAITQPIRVGDWVTFEEAYGVVEDVRLNYTFLRTASGQRVIIPNERLAAGVLRNDTYGESEVGLDVAVWIPPDADVAAALTALAGEPEATVSVAEVTPAGIRLSVGGPKVAPGDRAAREAALRASALQRLRDAGLLAGFASARANG